MAVFFIAVVFMPAFHLSGSARQGISEFDTYCSFKKLKALVREEREIRK